MKLLTMAYRMTLIAYCFVQFAVQVLWLSKWVMPRIMRSNRPAVEKRVNALAHAHRHVAIYLKTLSRVGLFSFEFIGRPVQGPAVVVANHPSLLDFIVLLKDFPNAVCLYKSQTHDNPVLATFVKLAGYVEGMDGTREASKRIVDECCQRLREGHHVVFFPEGTRSKSNSSVSRFRSTGFHAAIKSGVAVQPVVLYCDPLFLGKGQSWAEFAKRRNRMVIEYQEPVRVDALAEEERSAKGLAAHVRKVIGHRLVELERMTHVR